MQSLRNAIDRAEQETGRPHLSLRRVYNQIIRGTNAQDDALLGGGARRRATGRPISTYTDKKDGYRYQITVGKRGGYKRKRLGKKYHSLTPTQKRSLPKDIKKKMDAYMRVKKLEKKKAVDGKKKRRPQRAHSTGSATTRYVLRRPSIKRVTPKSSGRCVARDRSCVDEVDPITLENIRANDLANVVKLDKQCYDKTMLTKALQHDPRVPHNREPYTVRQLRQCIAKRGSNKSKCEKGCDKLAQSDKTLQEACYNSCELV